MRFIPALRALLVLLIPAACLWSLPPSGRDTGVLLLAHGGSPKWNQNVEALRRSVEKAGYPIEVAFGMADTRAMQAAVNKLEAKRVERIVAVTLLVNSQSELYDQFAYVLGKREKPSEELLGAFRTMKLDAKKKTPAEKDAHAHHRMPESKQIKLKTPVFLSPAMDDHPYVAQILQERIKKISRKPEEEVVLLISHGPYTDEADERWSAVADRVAAQMEKAGGFVKVKAFNLRDDSPQPVQKAKAQEIRAFAQAHARQKRRLLVLPHLISANGIERHIDKAMNGILYRKSKEALLPHLLAAQWVIEEARKIQKKEQGDSDGTR